MCASWITSRWSRVDGTAGITQMLQSPSCRETQVTISLMLQDLKCSALMELLHCIIAHVHMQEQVPAVGVVVEKLRS